MTFSDYQWDDVETVQPPLALLAVTGLLMVFGIVGLILSPVRVWATVGYIVCGLGAISTIGLYRFIDARLRSRPGYRLIPSARTICQALLIAAWLISVADAWRLATELSR
jgi:hypothetical protein